MHERLNNGLKLSFIGNTQLSVLDKYFGLLKSSKNMMTSLYINGTTFSYKASSIILTVMYRWNTQSYISIVTNGIRFIVSVHNSSRIKIITKWIC